MENFIFCAALAKITNQNRLAPCFPIYKTSYCICVYEEDKVSVMGRVDQKTISLRNYFVAERISGQKYLK